jgi:hypothetical protein
LWKQLFKNGGIDPFCVFSSTCIPFFPIVGNDFALSKQKLRGREDCTYDFSGNVGKFIVLVNALFLS